MMINYKLIFFVYAPVLLLLLLSLLRDRFEPENRTIKTCSWSLLPGIIVIGLFLSGEVIRSLWYANLIPGLKEYQYNPTNVEVFAFIYFLLLMLSAYLFLRHVYKVSLTTLFDYKSVNFYFLTKLYVILSVINISSIRLLDLNLFLNQQEVAELAKSFDVTHSVLFIITSIIIGPIAEELIFRGLIYSPLYRKVGRTSAIILSSLIWTQGHFASLKASIGIFAVGLLLAWLYDRKGSLIYPLGFHMFKNVWILIYFLK